MERAWEIEDAEGKRRKWEAQELEIATHRLTANLLRIMADGGRVFDLQRQLDETNKLAKQVGGAAANSTMQQALQLPWPSMEIKTDGDRNSLKNNA